MTGLYRTKIDFSLDGFMSNLQELARGGMILTTCKAWMPGSVVPKTRMHEFNNARA